MQTLNPWKLPLGQNRRRFSVVKFSSPTVHDRFFHILFKILRFYLSWKYSSHKYYTIRMDVIHILLAPIIRKNSYLSESMLDFKSNDMTLFTILFNILLNIHFSPKMHYSIIQKILSSRHPLVPWILDDREFTVLDYYTAFYFPRYIVLFLFLLKCPCSCNPLHNWKLLSQLRLIPTP